MSAGPTTDAVLVNLVLDGELEQHLRYWRGQTPPVSYEDIARLVNARIDEIADRVGAPTRSFKWSAIRRWCVEIYGIDPG